MKYPDSVGRDGHRDGQCDGLAAAPAKITLPSCTPPLTPLLLQAVHSSQISFPLPLCCSFLSPWAGLAPKTASEGRWEFQASQGHGAGQETELAGSGEQHEQTGNSGSLWTRLLRSSRWAPLINDRGGSAARAPKGRPGRSGALLPPALPGHFGLFSGTCALESHSVTGMLWAETWTGQRWLLSIRAFSSLTPGSPADGRIHCPELTFLEQLLKTVLKELYPDVVSVVVLQWEQNCSVSERGY